MAMDIQYQEEMLRILQAYPIRFKGPGPTQLLEFLYIGDYTDAQNLPRLQELGITHVLNMAPCSGKCPYKKDGSVVEYKAIDSDDDRNYDILQHFHEAKEFIDRVKRSKGHVLVHCAMGTNRSAAICMAYIMADKKMDLIQATQLMKDKRGKLLSNRGFQMQLIKFAKDRKLLPKLK